LALTQVQASIWSAKLLMALQKNLVFGQDAVTNKFYQQEISADGKEVHIHSLANITVVNYTKYTALTPEQLTDSRQTMPIDQQKAFIADIDDIDEIQSNPDVVQQFMDQAGYQLVEAADGYIAGLFAGATALGTVETSTAANLYARLLKASTLLTKNNVPREGRFVVLSPEFEELLLLSSQYQTAATESILNGAVGRIAGFDVLVSNNVVTSGTSPTQRHRVLAGHPMAWTFASQIQKIESVRRHDRFVDTVKGLYTYGAKVIRPEALVDVAVQI
jgi:N4-gp56 family major capsid protein